MGSTYIYVTNTFLDKDKASFINASTTRVLNDVGSAIHAQKIKETHN